jgi:hypothetical protein
MRHGSRLREHRPRGHVRGDLLLNLRLLLRPHGVVGLVATTVGLAVAATLYLPWYEIRTEVTMLGSTQARTVTEVAGWQAHPWLWLVAAVGIGVAITGAAIALDRPPPRARDLLLAGGVTLAGVTGLSALVVPTTDRFGASDTVEELLWLAERVPDDVEVALLVRPAVGVWLALGAAALLIAVGIAGRQR